MRGGWLLVVSALVVNILTVLNGLAVNAASAQAKWEYLSFVPRSPWIVIAVIAVLSTAVTVVHIRAAPVNDAFLAGVPDDGELDKLAHLLTISVRHVLDAEIGGRRMDELINLRLHVDRPGALPTDIDGFAATLDPQCRVVVTGPVGSGKTTTLTALARGLAGKRGATHPVPVLVSAADWDPDKRSLDDVLRERIYGPRRKKGRFHQLRKRADPVEVDLVSSGRVLPVVDGLDEMPPERWPAVRHRLAEAFTSGKPFLLACPEQRLPDILPGELVHAGGTALVRIQQVNRAMAVDYIRRNTLRGDPRWQMFLRHARVHHDSPVTQVLSSPLMIYLLVAAFRDGPDDPSRLYDRRLFPTPASVEAHLLSAFIPSAYAAPSPARDYRERPASRFPASQADAWLTHLAHRMHRERRASIQWWRLGFRGDPQTYPKAVVARWRPLDTVKRHPVLVLMLGAVLYLLARPPEYPKEWTAAQEAFHGNGLIPVAVALMLWLLLGTLERPAAGLRRGVTAEEEVAEDRRVARLQAGLAFTAGAPALIWWFANTWPVIRPTIADYQVRWTWMPVITLPGPIPSPWLSAAFGIGCTGGLVALLYWMSAANRFRLAVGWSAARGKLPWHLLEFLDDARARGVLRWTGTAYVFRHRRVQQYLISPASIHEDGHVVVHRAHDLYAAGRRNEARALLEDSVSHLPEATVELALLHEAWARSVPVRRLGNQRIKKELQLANSYWDQAVELGLPDAVIGHVSSLITAATHYSGVPGTRLLALGCAIRAADLLRAHLPKAVPDVQRHLAAMIVRAFTNGPDSHVGVWRNLIQDLSRNADNRVLRSYLIDQMSSR